MDFKEILNNYNPKENEIDPENLKRSVEHDLNLYSHLDMKMAGYIKLIFTIYSFSVPLAYAFYNAVPDLFAIIGVATIVNFVVNIMLYEIIYLKKVIAYVISMNIVRINYLEEHIYSTVYYLLHHSSDMTISILYLINMLMSLFLIVIYAYMSYTYTAIFLKVCFAVLILPLLVSIYVLVRWRISNYKQTKKFEKLDFR